MILLAILITLLYCIIIGVFIIGFDRIKEFKSNHSSKENSFSIIIPFRDEEDNLPELLESLKQLDYPKNKYEIIFVDDESQDDSVKVIDRFFVNAQNDTRILNNNRKTNSPKKDAINTAIKQAKYDWIITTDADCIVPKKWLNSFNTFIKKKQPQLIVAPVTYIIKNSFFERFQLLDFLSLQGVTIGAFGIGKPFLCNGANLCYSKAIFNELNGFNGNENIASGDDIFLLEKALKKHPDKVYYTKSKEAIVRTKPPLALKELINQRMRWAAKSTGYANIFSKLVAFSVLAINTLLITLLILSIFNYFNWLYLLLFFILKLSVDIILILKTASFFNQKKVLVSVLMSSFIYPFFSMFVAVASLVSDYQWKGRQFKK